MKTYEGRRENHSPVVTVNGQTLNPRLDLRNHSPTGFEWGYNGSGPAQLSLAILADSVGEDMALRYYQRFKREVIAGLPYRCWKLTEQQVQDALRSAEQAKKGGQDGRALFDL